jgi:Tfp pilus assembly protein PilF
MADSECEPSNYVQNVMSVSKKAGIDLDTESANLLLALGRYDDAIRHFELAHKALVEKRSDPAYERRYYNTCLRLAWCLDYVGDIDRAEAMLLESLPGGGAAIGDYAHFLHRRKAENSLAQRYYIMALKEQPRCSSVHLRYAGFLRHTQKDNIEAEKHYKLAVETNPKNSDALGNYASFLHGVSKQFDAAEDYYERAIALDPTHVNNYCNFGLFLSEERKNYSRAEVCMIKIKFIYCASTMFQVVNSSP